MVSKSAIDRTCGALLAALAVATVVAAAIGSQFETYDRSFEKAINEVADSSGLFTVGLVSSFIAGLAGVALASTMYLAYRGHDRTVSMVGALWLLTFGGAMIGASVAGSAVLHMADQFETAVGTNADIIAASARPIHIVRESSGIVGITVFLPLAMLTFGAIIVRHRAAPGWLGWLALVAGAAMLMFWVTEVGWAISMLGVPLALLWLVLLGGWMMLRGTRDATGVDEPEIATAPVPVSAE